MSESAHPFAYENYGAFYSSDLGGIIVDPGFMVLPIDDHMVHRGHGVFDTVRLVDGHLYLLEEHLERLKASAEMVGIPLPLSDAAIKRILLDTAAASRKLNGMVKVWLTRGRGDFSIGDAGVLEPGLYALVTTETVTGPAAIGIDRTSGWRAVASPFDAWPPYVAVVSSNNYLPGVLAQLDAESRDADVGLFVDDEGIVLEAPGANIAIVTEDLKLVMGSFDRALPGITIQRLASLVPEAATPDDLPLVGVEQRPISSTDLASALEAMLVSSALGVVPLVSWEGSNIGEGRPGGIALALQALLENDAVPKEGSAVHTPVPYGYLSGMKEQLV